MTFCRLSRRLRFVSRHLRLHVSGLRHHRRQPAQEPARPSSPAAVQASGHLEDRRRDLREHLDHQVERLPSRLLLHLPAPHHEGSKRHLMLKKVLATEP